MTASGTAAAPASGNICPSVTWPDEADTDAAFADLILLIHTNTLRDCRWEGWADVPSKSNVAVPALKKPNILKAESLSPLKKPKDFQKVAVMKMTLSPEGKKVSAKVKSTKVLRGFAPKKFARTGGTWKVKIIGDQTLSYSINSPVMDVEVEKDPDKGTFQVVGIMQPIDWTLVIPLYKKGKPLNAKRVEIWDTVTKKKVMESNIL